MGPEILVDKIIQEKCGVVAVYNETPKANLVRALAIAYRLQHRGQHVAGLAIRTKNKTLRYKGAGLLREVFTPEIIKQFNKTARWIMVHNRYATYGGYQVDNLQPCISLSSKNVPITVIQNGEFTGVKKMRKQLKDKRGITDDTSDTYIFTRLLAEAQGDNWDEKVISLINQSKGAFSLVIGIEDSLYVIRDPLGIRPLLIGKTRDGLAVASETSGLERVAATKVREVGRGEIIKIHPKGITTLQKGLDGEGNFCDFEWAYFSYPNSLSTTHENDNHSGDSRHWLSFSRFRERCGEMLAAEAKIPHASFVIGVPDSGVYVAMGYANKTGIPYKQFIIRDHFNESGLHRLFMQDDQKDKISKFILKKLTLNPDRMVWKNKIVVVGDDSVVRGNVSGQITRATFALGAQQVHWIIGFPPVAHPCHLGVSMRTGEELIAYRFKSDPKTIAKSIGATSVHYVSPQGFIQARKLTSDVKVPKDPRMIFLENGGCAGCVTGIYPVAKE